MCPKKLEETILLHKGQGRKPFFVNCTAGTTVMGAFDPMNDIADICQKHGIWMHVDVTIFIFNCFSICDLVRRPFRQLGVADF